MNDLFLKYRQEREGIEYILEKNGFATYKFLKDFCYLEDIYVTPDARKKGIAYELSQKVEFIAKKEGYTKMLGSVDISAKNPEISLMACFSDGYKILKLDNNIIWLHKEI